MPLPTGLLENLRSNSYTDHKLEIERIYNPETDEYESINDKECVELAEALSHNSHVTDLDLSSHYHIGDLGVQALSRLTNIRKLNLSNTGATLKRIAYLNENINLEVLNLGGNFLRDEHAQLIAQHPSVTDLDLHHNNNIGETGIRAFKDNTILKRLGLLNNSVYSRNIENLCQNQTIEDLVLAFNQLDDSCIPMLMNMPSLTSVNLSSNHSITPKAYAPLKEMLDKRRKEIEARDVKEERVEAPPQSFRKLFQ